jgi:hypothetical protein
MGDVPRRRCCMCEELPEVFGNVARACAPVKRRLG